MKPKKHPTSDASRDFFAAYRGERYRSFIGAVFLALGLAFGLVGFLRQEEIDFSGLMANVSQISTPPAVSYPADIILERSPTQWDIRYGGEQARAVNTIEGVILVNPDQIDMLTSVSPLLTLITVDTGMYRFVYHANDTSVMPGTLLGSVTWSGSSSVNVTLTDTSFTSATSRYHLSNIVE